MKETAVIDVVAVPVPLEPTTPIKPSEAIRLGACSRRFSRSGHSDTAIRACVFGAMSLGLGGRFVDDIVDPRSGLMGYWNKVVSATRAVPCPVADCGDEKDAYPAHLNDDHRWSRERIADWLESLGL